MPADESELCEIHTAVLAGLGTSEIAMYSVCVVHRALVRDGQ